MSNAGIVTVVFAEVTGVTYAVAPVHRSKTLPARLDAVTSTACLFVYDPPPLPLVTVSA